MYAYIYLKFFIYIFIWRDLLDMYFLNHYFRKNKTGIVKTSWQ